MPEDHYLEIGDYGLIGDMNSAALVSREGSIDWLCFPRFDSPSVFAAVLDAKMGGRFDVAVADLAATDQAYMEDTNLLRTRLRAGEGVLEVVDYMPCYLKNGDLEAFHEVHRRLRCEEGRVTARVRYEPRFRYGMEHAQLHVGDDGCLARGSREWMSLATDMRLEAAEGVARGEEPLEEGDERWLILRWADDYLRPCQEFRPAEKLEKTRAYWKEWINRCVFHGPWAPLVRRSLLVLKLMIYEPTGAIIAAPTTSLPEVPGGAKNWDYRFSWLRDSAYVLSAFHRCGYTKEERRYRHWLIRRLRGHTLDLEQLQIMYSVEGDAELREEILSHLRGYRGASPVRAGNAAYDQFQLDVYGSVIDALHFSYHTDADMNDDVWRTVESIANFVSANWARPDSGIWELREHERRYVHSHIMAWVAMDRAVKVARRWGNARRAEQWTEVRERIREHVLQVGFSEELNAFTQYYGGEEVDGSLLVIPLVGFLSGKDARFQGTLDRIRRDLGEGPLVRRFREKGPQEGSFLMLSYWMVEGMADAGRLEEAKSIFEKLQGYANHLGLFAEMADLETGRQLGNFPQAFTHMALVNAAWKLAKAEAGS